MQVEALLDSFGERILIGLNTPSLTILPIALTG
jgi:hypothetical protein